MATKIIPKKSSVASKVPLSTDLDVGEVAINLTDKRIYSKTSGNDVIEFSSDAADLAHSWGDHALAGYLTSVSWGQVTDKPTFATVAYSASYNDLVDLPTIPSGTMANYGEATADMIQALGTETNGITVRRLADALDKVSYDGTTAWAPNWEDFFHAEWVINGNRTIQNPTNVIVGQTKTAVIKSTNTNPRTISWAGQYVGNIPDIAVTSTNYVIVSMTPTDSSTIAVSYIEVT